MSCSVGKIPNTTLTEFAKVIGWYATATDIDDKKKTEERLRNENLVLREEIDRSSMFEEVVGASISVHGRAYRT